MTHFLVKLDRKVKLVFLLYFFFAGFWTLNGFDKFFNGEFRHDTNPNVAKFAILDAETGELEYRIQKYRTHGLFGVNRDEAFREYFSQLGLSYEVSQYALYTISYIEIVLGLIFLYIFLRSILGIKNEYSQRTLYGTRTLHRLAFKVSTLLFTAFVMFDNLTGDRFENLEHSIFFLLLLFTYYLFLQAEKIEKVEYEQLIKGWEGEKNRRSNTAEYAGVDRRSARKLNHAKELH
jgi:hypothetical protein